MDQNLCKTKVPNTISNIQEMIPIVHDKCPKEYKVKSQLENIQ